MASTDIHSAGVSGKNGDSGIAYQAGASVNTKKFHSAFKFCGDTISRVFDECVSQVQAILSSGKIEADLAAIKSWVQLEVIMTVCQKAITTYASTSHDSDLVVPADSELQAGIEDATRKVVATEGACLNVSSAWKKEKKEK